MTKHYDPRAAAYKNSIEALARARRLPDLVFHGTWHDFLFFDSDWIFEAEFLKRVQDLLVLEGGISARLARLDEVYDSCAQTELFIEQDTSIDAFRQLLKGSKVGEGWINDFGRFGCTSNIGSWYIYSERRSEVALIGFKKNTSAAKFLSVTQEFHAKPIEAAINESISYGFSSGALSERWRKELLAHYGSPSKT